MGIGEKRIYLEAIRSRYRQAGRVGKSTILDEFCAVCGYQRKYAIRLLGAVPTSARQRPDRPIAIRCCWTPFAASGWPPTRCAASDWSPQSRCGYRTTRRSTARWRRRSKRGCSAPRRRRWTVCSALFDSTIPKAFLPLVLARYSNSKFPSVPNGISHSLGSSRPIPSPTAAIRWPVILCGASPSPTSTPAGRSAERPGTRGRTASSRKSPPLSGPFPFPCAALIVTTMGANLPRRHLTPGHTSTE